MKHVLALLAVCLAALTSPPASAAPYFTQNSWDHFTVNNGEVTAQGAVHCENLPVAPAYLTFSVTDPAPASANIATAGLDPSRAVVTSVQISTSKGPKFWRYYRSTPGVAETPGDARVTKANNGGFAVVGMIAVENGAASVGAPVPFEIDALCERRLT